jgi:hypothetical protein
MGCLIVDLVTFIFTFFWHLLVYCHVCHWVWECVCTSMCLYAHRYCVAHVTQDLEDDETVSPL